MANNRMYLANAKTGQRVLIAKHYANGWRFWDTSVDYISDAFNKEDVESRDWCIRYEHGDPNIDTIPAPES